MYHRVQETKEKYHDVFEFVNNIKQLRGKEKMAEYTARYINHSTEMAIKSLNLERFATKEDLQKLDYKVDLVEQRLDAKIDSVEQRLEGKLQKHTMFLLFTIILSTLIPDSVKHSLWSLMHL